MAGAAVRVGERGTRSQIGAAAMILRRAGKAGAEGIGGVPGVQRGAVEKCAGERDVIGPPFGDDGFGLLRIGNHADRLERDLAAASDGLHKRHLITGPGRSPACGAIPLLETHT
jgi:hypothetical protein